MVRSSTAQLFIEDSSGSFIEIPYLELDWEQPGTNVSEIPKGRFKVPYNTTVEDSTGSLKLVKDLVTSLTDVEIHRNGEKVWVGEVTNISKKVSSSGFDIEADIKNKYYLQLKNIACDVRPASARDTGSFSGAILNPWDFSSRSVAVRYPSLQINQQVNYNLSIPPEQAVQHLLEKRFVNFLTPAQKWVFPVSDETPTVVSYLPQDSGDVDTDSLNNAQQVFRFWAGDAPITIQSLTLSHSSPLLSESFYGNCECDVSVYGFRTKDNRTDVVHLSDDVLSLEIYSEDSDSWVSLTRNAALDDWDTDTDFTGWRSGWSGTVNIQGSNISLRIKTAQSLPADFNTSSPEDFLDLFFVKISVVNEDQHAVAKIGTIDNYSANPTNLLKNPGFERSSGSTSAPDNWTINEGTGWTSGPTFSILSVPMGGLPDGMPGSKHLSISAVNSDGGTSETSIEQTVGVDGGDTYSFGVWVDYQTLSDDPPVAMKVEWLDSNGSVLQTDSDSRQTQGRIVVNGVSAPGSAVEAKVTIEASSDGTSSQDSVSVLVDGAMFQKSDTLDSFVGNIFGKIEQFFYEFYGSNRLQGLEAVRKTAALDFKLDDPHWDLWLDPATGEVNFVETRGETLEEVFSFSNQNLLSLDITENSDIVNVLEAVGAGNGPLGQVRLQGSLVDTDSVASFGRREHVFSDTSVTDVQTLEAKAWAFLKAHSSPTTIVDAELRSGFDVNLNVGDKVTVVDDHFGLDTALRVESLTHKFGEQGEDLDISFFEKFPAQDGLMSELNAKTDATKAKDSKGFTNAPTMGTEMRFSMIDDNGDGNFDTPRPAGYSFFVPSGKKVKAIKFFARTASFDSFGRGAESGGGITTTSESGTNHDHSVNIPDTSSDGANMISEDLYSGTEQAWSSTLTTTESFSLDSFITSDFVIVSMELQLDQTGRDVEVEFEFTSTNETGAPTVARDHITMHTAFATRTFIFPMDFVYTILTGGADGIDVTLSFYEPDTATQIQTSGDVDLEVRKLRDHNHAISNVNTGIEGGHTHDIEIPSHTHEIDQGIFTLQDGSGNDIFPLNVKAFRTRDDVDTDTHIQKFGIMNPSGEDLSTDPTQESSGSVGDWKFNSDKRLGVDLTDDFREVPGDAETPVASGEHTIFFGVTDTPDGTDNPKNLGKVYVNHVILLDDDNEAA